jgi:hypothetical protein
MEREDEDEDVIWNGLQIAIERVESMRAERCRNWKEYLIRIICREMNTYRLLIHL